MLRIPVNRNCLRRCVMPTTADTMRQLTQAVIRLSNQGIHDPTAREITDEHFGRGGSPSEVEYVRSRLHFIRQRLEREHDTVSCPVNSLYYRVHRGRPISTSVDARNCVAGINGKSAGIYIPQQSDDQIIEAWLEWNIRSGSGKNRANADRTLTLWQQQKLSGGHARGLLRQIPRQSAPLNQQARRALGP